MDNCTIINFNIEGYNFRIARDYHPQPFGENGVLATLAEAYECLEGERSTESLWLLQFGLALHRAWRRYSDHVCIIDNQHEDLNDYDTFWVYDIYSLDYKLNVSVRMKDFRINKLVLKIPLDQAKSFALLATYNSDLRIL